MLFTSIKSEIEVNSAGPVEKEVNINIDFPWGNNLFYYARNTRMSKILIAFIKYSDGEMKNINNSRINLFRMRRWMEEERI